MSGQLHPPGQSHDRPLPWKTSWLPGQCLVWGTPSPKRRWDPTGCTPRPRPTLSQTKQNQFRFSHGKHKSISCFPNPPRTGLALWRKQFLPECLTRSQEERVGPGDPGHLQGTTHRRGTCPEPGISAGGSAGSGCGWCGRSGSSSDGSRSSWHCSAGSSERNPARDGTGGVRKEPAWKPAPAAAPLPAPGIPGLTLQPSQVMTP